MPLSSASVAALAGALAKAQAELTNPEKSMTATLPAEANRPERSFRYAPLSGGLDIVRKTLGRHEIATLQTTAVDPATGTIRLTTMLAHASGEWISSEWPVCPSADMASPRRMGAALTYARRYALFTLVGIAGEDDLDAPDLGAPDLSVRDLSARDLGVPSSSWVQEPSPSVVPSRSGRNGKTPAAPQFKTLNPNDSAEQRDRLVTELAALGSMNQAADWAKRTLPIKNTLVREHACEVEAAFEKTVARFGDHAQPIETAPAPQAIVEVNDPSGEDSTKNQNHPSSPAASNGSSLSLRISRRRDKAHLRFVASQPCLLCGRRPSDAHHLRFAQPAALGAKVSDEFTVPLCRTHHRQLHRTGNETQWWSAIDRAIDPLEIARGLWQQSHSP